VKTQNWLKTYAVDAQPIDSHLVETFREVSSHRANVAATLITRHGKNVRDLSSITEIDEQVTACVEAMTQGVPIILNAQLPVDWENHRCGIADVLLRADDSDNPKYYPGIIKDSNVLSTSVQGHSHQLLSTLVKPFLHDAENQKYQFRFESHSSDLLQLAHLWFLLRSAGFAAEDPWGAIIGTDFEDVNRCCFVSWMNLQDKLVRAFSYTSAHAWRKYTPLSRYQHEHRFRVRVGSRALQAEEAGLPLVASPVHVPECDMCEWWPECQAQLGDDVSVMIERSPLDAREIMTLRSFGILTITDLASSDVDALLPQYLPKVAHRSGADTRLRLAARRGRLIAAGIHLERLTTGAIELPSAPVEIDIDIETSSNNRVYLWGFLVDDRRLPDSEPVYYPIHRFASLTQARELELAEEAATWLMEKIQDLGETEVLVWHYSNYEISTLRRFASFRRQASPALSWLSKFTSTNFVDLLPVVKRNFFGVDGLGLKAVATEGAGFSWRDPEPSGLNSQFWFSDAIHADNAKQRQAITTRILEYNEDDTRATRALRQWLRSLD